MRHILTMTYSLDAKRPLPGYHVRLYGRAASRRQKTYRSGNRASVAEPELAKSRQRGIYLENSRCRDAPAGRLYRAFSSLVVCQGTC
jgi:hypothetical protein